MRWRLAAMVFAALGVALTSATAHHSMAMFDQQNPKNLEGVVREFKFVSPHTFIMLEVKGTGDSVETWSLEGDSPSHMARDGWTHESLKPGDKVKLTVAPLRSGAPGGFWTSEKIFYEDGKPIVAPESQ
jgi:hypothetical protein